ncbi:endo-1,4-beta-xylanase [Saccharicrinis fermentans]|uniref:Glycosyl hydrolase family 10 n=1 Tax=Saccharicrinis fermentans DSM 9555 = JCM 21142 TaxID=869213 RepID=W7YNM8_9BACT|nr:endo-1,4-beta-xylanase [Saccharicrinis fermentans]GAF04034.1 glycosyl hydrolase family 10 [Saccharicrinis fermentans DSM 9555 = JCM 21142]
MNYFNNICLGVLAIVLISSCADESLLDYDVKKPEQIQNYDYLKEYDVLKEYVSRESHPDFILGAGVSLPDFNKKGYQYAHIVSNFNEITAGYNMKHGAIVTNNGDLQLAGVVQFVETAEQAGITIYGHTLCWHSNQNATYLNNIIAPTIIPPSGG